MRAIYDGLLGDGAELIAVLGDLSKGPDRDTPDQPLVTLENLPGADSPLVDAYHHARFCQLYDPKDTGRERPGSFQSCVLETGSTTSCSPRPSRSA